MSGSSLKWRVPNRWNVVHSDGEHIRLEVSQDGNTLLGSAHRVRGREVDTTTGIVNGSVDGHQLYELIYWPNNLIDNYLGTVSGQGNVEGTKVDQTNPATVARWYGEPALTEWS